MSADLYGWSAMMFEKHWLQRIGVTQARARAALLTEGVRSRQQAACEVPWGPGVETVSMQYAVKSRAGRATARKAVVVKVVVSSIFYYNR